MDLNNCKILVVDDTPANIQVLGPLLKQQNYQVFVAQNGLQALSTAAKVIPDLILLDIMMPGIDGFETCRRLKEAPNCQDIPVIFLSAKNQTEDVVKGFELGGVDYITKPFNPAELTVRIKTHLELKKTREHLIEARNQLAKENEIERALRLKTEIFSKAVHNAASGVLITDANYKITYANPKFCETTGYNLVELLGQTPGILSSGETPHETFAGMLKDVKAGKEWHGQVINRRKTGELYSDLLSVSSIAQPDGTITHFIATSEDMSAQLRLEELAREQKEREATEKLINQFLSTVSHELRTPLNGIMGMTNILQESDLDIDQLECLEVVNDASTDLLDVINNMINFVEIQSGKMAFQPEKFLLAEFLENLCESFAHEAKRKQLDFYYHIDSGLPEVIRNDAAKLRDILSKLINNAIKFTEAGFVKTTVKQKGQSLIFEVRDTGIGIDAQMKEKIFQAFTQADNSMTRSYDGMGIGLAIASTLCSIINGTLWFESQSDGGTSFFLEIKLSEITS